MRSVYVLGDDGALREVRVPTGITDGSWTEALGGLREGVRVVTGRLAAGEEAQPAANGRSPFMPGPPQRRWH